MDDPVPVLEPVLPRRPRRLGRFVPVVAIVLVGVAAVAGVFILAKPGPGTATPPLLAVIETGGGLATMDGLGGHLQRQALAPGTQLRFPAWSPDGSHVAAIGIDGNSGSVDVFAADAAPGNLPRTIYESADGPPFYLYWSPDSRKVGFLTDEQGGIALRIAPADASSPAEIVRQAEPLYWDFVDPSRLLLHTGASGPGAFLGEVGLDGTSLEGSVIASGMFRAPAVGGDGRSRAYVMPAGVDPEGAQQIVVEARDGSTRHEIPIGRGAAISFDPTSTTLAFIGPDEASDEAPIPIGPLRTIDAASGEVRTLLDGDVVGFFWSPDGNTIAALDVRPAPAPDPGEARAAVGRTAAAGVATVAAPPLAADRPGIALHLSFVDSGSAAVRSERDVRVSELFAFQLLPYFDQYALSHRLWSSDSSAIVLPLVDDDGTERVVVVPADGSDPRTVAIGSIGFWSP